MGTMFIKTSSTTAATGGKPRADRDPLHPSGEDMARAATSTTSTSGTPTSTDATLVVNDIEGDPNKDEPVMITIKRTGTTASR